jgi:hypothetical protein
MWKRGKIFAAFVLAHKQRVVFEWRIVRTEDNSARSGRGNE